MTIFEALKEVKSLKKQLAKLYVRISDSSCIESGHVAAHDVTVLKGEAFAISKRIMELKTKIAVSNAMASAEHGVRIIDLIYEKEMLQANRNALTSMNSGASDRFLSARNKTFSLTFNEAIRDAEIDALDKQIETIDSKIDLANISLNLVE